MNEDIKKAANTFRKNMQEISDKTGHTISVVTPDGNEHVISNPKTVQENVQEQIQEGSDYPVATLPKHNFTSPLHLACAKDELRPTMCCVHFLNGFAYASDAHILVKQSLELHTILNPEKLNGKGIHKDSFKQILDFKIVEAHDDYILCIDGERRAEFMYFKGAAAPNYEAVIPVDETLGVHHYGINPKFITIAGKILHGSDYGIRMTFRGANKACILTTEEYKTEQLVLIMPVMLEPTLF